MCTLEVKRKAYVVDTNVLLDYPDIIPSPGERILRPENPTVDLSGAEIIIPTVAIRELSKFKREKSDRGKNSRTVLRRLREIFEPAVGSFEECYNLKDGAKVTIEDQVFSILPIHTRLRNGMPFNPSDADMDGQIVLAALAVKMLHAGIHVDGSARYSDYANLKNDDVVLLTNDNGLAIRARTRGIKTSRYGHKTPDPYTGRRDLVVPKELFKEFVLCRRIERETWEKLMPSQPPLVANEFIVMSLRSDVDYLGILDPCDNRYFENIGRYDAEEDAIVQLECIGESFPLSVRNAGQAIYKEAILNDKFATVICDGPAGTGKTYMATILGYLACTNGDYIGMTIVPCTSKNELGALPGDLDEKMDPEVQPVKNAIRNYLLENDSTLKKKLAHLQKFGPNDACGKKAKNGCKRPSKYSEDYSDDFDDNEDTGIGKNTSIKAYLADRVELIWKNWFTNIPIENARGRDFAYEIVFYDEFQDQNQKQADTLIKRLGKHGKNILAGDVEQIHAPYLDEWNNGLVYATQELYDNPYVVRVHFTEEEVVRHPLVKILAERQKAKRERKED